MSGPTYSDSYSQNAAENYERYFVPSIGRPVATTLVEAADLRGGERVLDVACGTGIVARLAAERVGPNGAVEGLDPNPGMLAVAREAASSDASMAWHEAPAETMPLPDEFLWQYIHSTPMAAVVAEVDEERREALERDFSERCRDLVKDGALVGTVRMTTLTAKA